MKRGKRAELKEGKLSEGWKGEQGRTARLAVNVIETDATVNQRVGLSPA